MIDYGQDETPVNEITEDETQEAKLKATHTEQQTQEE